MEVIMRHDIWTGAAALACTLMPITSGAAELPRERSGKETVEAVCVRCHGTGEHGAPKIGDRTAWIQRLRYGFDPAVSAAINGHGWMPSRGGAAHLTDREVRSAIAYMFNPDPPLSR
jgi:cytochrome c5